MNNTLKSMRLHIGIFGKRNVGKSSLINFITGQKISIVSDTAGTTTDPVEKVMELLPIGPVLFIDTAGIDDIGALGEERVKKTFEAINRIDIALVLCDYNGFDEFEFSLIEEFKKRNTPFAIIINKNDTKELSSAQINILKNQTDNILSINTKNSIYLTPLKQLILKIMPDGFFDDEKILDDIIKPCETVVQVIPIDKEAPKGRLILPQVRTIRNALDNGAISLVTRETELKEALSKLKEAPKLVITDSQVFSQVEKIIPANVMLTSYSILFAKLKGDLGFFTQSAQKISSLNNGDKILVCESCTHHPVCNDIGRVKIPNLLKKTTGKELIFETFAGHDFPQNLEEYALIVHCGGCMTNKKEILSRILLAKEAQIPMTNYGIAIAYCLGILDRAVEGLL